MANFGAAKLSTNRKGFPVGGYFFVGLKIKKKMKKGGCGDEH